MGTGTQKGDIPRLPLVRHREFCAHLDAEMTKLLSPVSILDMRNEGLRDNGCPDDRSFRSEATGTHITTTTNGMTYTKYHFH